MPRLALGLGLHALLLLAPALLLGGGLGWAVGLWLGCALSLQALERWAARGWDDEPGRGRDAQLALLTGLGLLAVQWLSLGEHALRDPSPALAWVGLGSLFALGGAALRGAAIRTLDGDFVSDPQGRVGDRLCERGVYAWSRHPSEVGLAAHALGGCLVLGSALGLLAVGALLLPVCAWRLVREDRALDARFPGYTAYRARVGWAWPRVRLVSGSAGRPQRG